MSFYNIDNLSELILYLIDNISKEDPIIYINSNYKDIIYEEVRNLIDIQLENIELKDEELKDDELNIDDLIIYNIEYYSDYIYCRSHKDTKILKNPDKKEIKNKLYYLNSVYQPEQRTTEWYNFRHKYLTASSIWKVFYTDSSKRDLLINKCTPIDIKKYDSVNLYSPLHHGQKYEYLSVKWYENNYKTTISEYGCIPHKEIEYIAASPDGINSDPRSQRYGRMLEIKNIFNREINGIPKKEYWIQMQVQMEVCDLDECDFLETRFVEYEDEESFMSDGEFNKTEDNKQKGIIILFIDNNGKPKYEYSPWNINKKEYLKWEEEVLNNNKKKEFNWFKNIYWKLDEISCVLVERNKNWFNKSKKILSIFWEELTKLKNNKLELDNLLNSKKLNSKKLKSDENNNIGFMLNLNELIDIEYKLIDN